MEAAGSDEALACLRSAFSDLNPPSAEEVSYYNKPLSAQLMCTEEYSTALYFGGKKWTEITGSRLEASGLHIWWNTPSTMSVRAFHYYLPAFMEIMICDLERGPTLGMMTIPQLSHLLKTRQLSLSPKQLDAIAVALFACIDIWQTNDYEVEDLIEIARLLRT